MANAHTVRTEEEKAALNDRDRTMAMATLKASIAVAVALAMMVCGTGAAAVYLGSETEQEPVKAELMAVQKEDGMIDVNDFETFVPPPAPVLPILDEQVLTLAFSPVDYRLITAGASFRNPGQLKIWDAKTAKELSFVRGISGARSVAFSPDGESVATGDLSGTIRLRDGHSGAERGAVHGHKIGVNGVAFSKDGKALASAGLDWIVRIWDTKELKEQKALAGHTDMIFTVAYFRNGKALVSGGKDKTAIIWNVETGKEKFTLRGHLDAVEMVAVSLDDRIVATASRDQTIKLWDAETGIEKDSLRGHKSGVFAMAISPDGKQLASGDGSGSVLLWDLATKKLVGGLAKHGATVRAVAFSHDGKYLASGSSDTTAKVWDLAAGKEIHALKTSSLRPVRALAYAPDGNVFAIATDGKKPRIHDAKTGTVLNILPGHQGEVTCLVFSPDGKTIATGSLDETVKLWDRATGKEKRTLKGHVGDVLALAFSPDNKMLASGGRDMMVRVWDPGTGDELARFNGHESAIQALAFDPLGRALASGSADRTIRVWFPKQKTEPITLKAHAGTVRALAFSDVLAYASDDAVTVRALMSSRALLASASDDGTVKVWQAADGRLWIPAEGKEPVILKGHAGAVSSVAFLRGGRTLVSGGDDGNVIVWDPVQAQFRGLLMGHGQAVSALAIHPQGLDLLSGSLDARVLRWKGARGTQLPVVEDANRIAPSGKKEAKQGPEIEDVPKPRESYAKEYYHSFKDNAEDAKDFELIGPNADECVKFEPAGLRIVLPAGHPGQRLSTGVASRFAINGDFEITLQYEILKEGQGSGLFLGVDLNTMSYNRASLTRGLRDSRHFFSWFQLSHEGSDKPYRDEVRAFPSAGVAASLRLVRTGSDLAHYVAEGTGAKFTLLRHHPFGTEDVRAVRLGGQTSGPLDARMIDVRVRADSLPDMPDVPLAAQEAGAKTWLLVSTLISFSALVCMAVSLYARRRGAMPATVPSDESGGRVDGAPPLISFACRSCGKKLRARPNLAGRRAKCPKCGLVVLLPSTTTTSTTTTSTTTSSPPDVPRAEHP